MFFPTNFHLFFCQLSAFIAHDYVISYQIEENSTDLTLIFSRIHVFELLSYDPMGHLWINFEDNVLFCFVFFLKHELLSMSFSCDYSLYILQMPSKIHAGTVV